VHIQVMTNKDDGFYELMGPFLANRLVVKELGFPIYDDDDKTWFIATEGENVVGFCYRQKTKVGKYQIGSCYVTDSNRGQGLFGRLLEAATDSVAGIVSLTTNKAVMAIVLKKNGFSAKVTRGSYTTYERRYGDE
jgi:GNAT superfamily N-acetyltransferase